MGLCMCARGGGRPFGVARGLPRGLGGFGPALRVSGGLSGMTSSAEGQGRAQEIRGCLGVKIHQPLQGAAPSNRLGLRPQNPAPPSFGLFAATPTPSPPGLPPVCCRENRESGPSRARHPLGMLGRRDPLRAGRARPPPAGRRRAPAPHTSGGSGDRPVRPEPSAPTYPEPSGARRRGGPRGGEARRRESHPGAARGSLESTAGLAGRVPLLSALRGGARPAGRWSGRVERGASLVSAHPLRSPRPQGIIILWESVWFSENPRGGELGRSWRKMVKTKSLRAPRPLSRKVCAPVVGHPLC